jgi:hypothetical protein
VPTFAGRAANTRHLDCLWDEATRLILKLLSIDIARLSKILSIGFDLVGLEVGLLQT